MKKIITIILISFFILTQILGCAAIPYKYKKDIEQKNALKLRINEKQIERGRPNKFLDGLGHYVFSLPGKLILWNWKVGNRNVSEDSEKILAMYLKDNNLENVKVRINQYAPGGEWRRLFLNKEVSPFYRYTFGFISAVKYTILPDRVFAESDYYNPFTNTINLYSDHNAILLHEAGHAKDFESRTYKGTYALLGLLPVFPLYQEGKATEDAIGYLKDRSLLKDEKESYKVLYPAYGTYIAGEGLNWASKWVTYSIYAVTVIPGHIIGRIKSSNLNISDSTISGN